MGADPQYTTVYVGNLAPEVTSAELHHQFYSLGAGVIEDVRLQRDKGFGFVRYNSHAEAARAIQLGNARILFGKPLKCSWGSKPTPAGTSSTPLPPPAASAATAAGVGGYSAADLAAYGRQMSLARMGGPEAIYDGGFPNTQPPIYYQ